MEVRRIKIWKRRGVLIALRVVVISSAAIDLSCRTIIA